MINKKKILKLRNLELLIFIDKDICKDFSIETIAKVSGYSYLGAYSRLKDYYKKGIVVMRKIKNKYYVALTQKGIEIQQNLFQIKTMLELLNKKENENA